MLQPWQDAVVTKIIQETPNTKRFFLALTSGQVFDFIPGQFVTFDLPIHEQKNKRWRSYSIASAPSNNNEFELVIVLLDGGAGTTYLFNEVAVGSTLLMRGPQGVFVLPKSITTDLYFICTGTGIAPFRSMLHQIKNEQREHQRIDLVFGTRTLDSTLFMDEMRQLEKEWTNFHYHIALSREQSTQWNGTKGYVHQIYEKLYADQRDAYFYICGWDDMINEAKSRLEAMNYKKRQHIIYESYS